MTKKWITGSLALALLFGGALQTTSQADASSHYSTDQLYQNHSIYAMLKHNGEDWFTNIHKGQADTSNNDDKTTENHETAPDASESSNTTQEREEQTNKDKSSEKSNQKLSEFEKQVVKLTNDERKDEGLDPLKIDHELSQMARDKSRDMADSDYFSHDSPNYGSPFDMMDQYGINYDTAGENIARGQQTPEDVVNEWMNSEGHRENIMNPDFSHIGVGYVENGDYWTQEFIGK